MILAILNTINTERLLFTSSRDIGAQCITYAVSPGVRPGGEAFEEVHYPADVARLADGRVAVLIDMTEHPALDDIEYDTLLGDALKCAWEVHQALTDLGDMYAKLVSARWITSSIVGVQANDR